MSREFKLPDLGEGITEAQIIRVLIKQGDTIAEDQYLVEVETDKAAVEIPSPFAGVASHVHVQEGQTVNVGDVIVTFDDGDGAAVSKGKSKATASQVAASSSDGASAVTVAAAPRATTPIKTKTAAAPAVRKLARELGVELDRVVGTGPGGRVVRTDVESHKKGAAPTTPKRIAPQRSAPLPGIADADKWGPTRREPLSQIRKTIANRMTQSAFTIPHVTHTDEADITDLERMRKSLNEATGNDPKLTMMTFVIRATCLALNKFPIFNASFDEEGQQIIYKDYVNMGIAVDTDRGLIVPIIRNAERFNLPQLAAELQSMAARIRSKKFGVEDLRGGSFTLTNVGALGGGISTPIINYPEVAILGLGRSRMVPVVRDNQIEPGLVMPVCLSFDHRATDGANAARFTREIVSFLETPGKFLLD
jgi:pyruvate dehydrogenase E2 component (dihydrolipoamide acetyltransferase)